MRIPAIPAFNRLTRNHAIAAAGLAAVGASVLGFTVTPGTAQAAVPANPVMTLASYAMGGSDSGSHGRLDVSRLTEGLAQHTAAQATAAQQLKNWPAPQPRAAQHAQPQAANRSEQRRPIHVHARPKPKHAPAPAAPSYPDNLDGWIRHALDIMHQHGIPGSYEGIRRNILRESSGDPRAINNWDINARNGIPSKGLLQVIQPTFETYHVAGTSNDIYDPVANIAAACNYAAHRYGSMDFVNSAY